MRNKLLYTTAAAVIAVATFANAAMAGNTMADNGGSSIIQHGSNQVFEVEQIPYGKDAYVGFVSAW
ncbi:MAG: hypothetical protein WCL30_01740 [Pseudomonadota bacterium]